MITLISQSFIKDMREYLMGSLCGNIIHERWVNDRLLEDPDKEPGAMELGTYFEFLLTGALPKNGKQPLPVYMVSAIKKNGGSTIGLGVSDMYVNYRNAHTAAQVVREYIDAWGLKIVGRGIHMVRDGYQGVLDIVCEVVRVVEGFTWNVGDRIVIDTKYSGLLEDGFKNWKNKHGWNWSPVQKEYHGIQAKQYSFVSSGFPFYFLVTQSSKNEEIPAPMVKLFHVLVDDDMVERHLAEGNDLYSKFLFYHENTGFTPKPSMSKCLKCPLFKECPDKHIYPYPEVVDLTID